MRVRLRLSLSLSLSLRLRLRLRLGLSVVVRVRPTPTPLQEARQRGAERRRPGTGWALRKWARSTRLHCARLT